MAQQGDVGMGTRGITYLDADPDVSAFLGGIAGTRDLAVDTEGASFHRFVDRIYLLQLSTPDQHAIVDPLAVAPPTGLGTLISDPKVEVVFHDADYDLRLLRQDYGWSVRGLFDTRVAAQLSASSSSAWRPCWSSTSASSSTRSTSAPTGPCGR
jgi:ribonuclease D